MSLQKESATCQRLGQVGGRRLDIRQGRLQDVLQLEDGDRTVQREEHRLERGHQSCRVTHLGRALNH